MRILLTKGTPSAPKSQSRFIHIHKSLGESCLCSPEPARGTERKRTRTKTGNAEKMGGKEQTKRALFATVNKSRLSVSMSSGL